ncbi:hypothetical protein LX36DRAFT_496979 [Colletotrichum falcatum]|nr:hypothetical protein LX36DRAFT_496979 [Colletotrichum falcatum]
MASRGLLLFFWEKGKPEWCVCVSRRLGSPFSFSLFFSRLFLFPSFRSILSKPRCSECVEKKPRRKKVLSVVDAARLIYITPSQKKDSYRRSCLLAWLCVYMGMPNW